MAHLIELTDRTFSTDGDKAWHKKAITPVDKDGNFVKSLSKEDLQEIFWEILTTEQVYAHVAGIDNVPLQSTMPIFADLRPRGEGLIHIGTHSPGYGPVTNERVFDGLKESLSHTPHEITTAGTLKDSRLFYVSARPTEGGSFTTANGEKFQNFIVGFTSHDGTCSKLQYGTCTRPVCMNTVQMGWSSAKGKMTVKHSRNVEVYLKEADKAFRDLLTQQADFIQVYDRLSMTPVNHDTAMEALTGYMWKKTGKPDKISTRSRNVIDDIFARYLSGPGNAGKTGADLLNGLTEYYSVGDGAAGAKADAFEKAIGADFGGAADAKLEFARLLAQPDGLSEIVHIGANGGMEAYSNGIAAAPGYQSALQRNRSVSGAYGQRAVSATPVSLPPSRPVSSDFASLLDAPFSPKQ